MKFTSLLLITLISTYTLNGQNNSEQTDYFADNGFGNAVAVVQHPVGVYHNGVTYVCYQGPLEDPYVVSYDHKTGEWKGPYKAGVSEMGKDPSRKNKIDNHGKPSMIIDNAGFIHITFGGHGGMKKHGENTLGNYHYGKNLHAVSKKPLDISSWETLDNISPFGTYNQLIKMDNGTIYLFYRHGAHRSDWVYQVSEDNGRTFTTPISFLKHKRRTDAAAVDSWYPYITRGKKDELIVVFDYHVCRDVKNAEDKRGHIGERHNIYYMNIDTNTGKWKNVFGESLKMPLTKEIADSKTMITNTNTDWTFQGVIDLDPDGSPHVCMTIGADIGEKKSAPKHMQHFRWDGEQWKQHKNSGLPIGNGDLKVKSKNNVSVYMESTNELGDAEVSRWDSFNAGETFNKANVFLSQQKSSYNISSLIDNAHPNARFVVAEKKSGSEYKKIYLLGDNGPVKRNKKDAHILEK